MDTKLKKVLVPIDFSDYSKSALNYAADFAKKFNAGIILIYVVEPVIYPPDFSMGQIAVPSINTEWDMKAKEELDKLAKTEIPDAITVNTVIKTGKPFIEIIETASEEDVDIIITPTSSTVTVFSLILNKPIVIWNVFEVDEDVLVQRKLVTECTDENDIISSIERALAFQTSESKI